MSLSDEACKAIYKKIKTGKDSKFDEAKHCTMLIKVMSDPNRATMAAFCVEAGIGDSTFYRWLSQYEVFQECYRYGCMVSLNNWDKIGTMGMNEETFNIEVWKTQGSARYGVGKTNRVRVHVNADSTPFDQYKQLMMQASNGDFTSGELKQLMESVNIGLRAYEVVELQKQVKEMRTELERMVNHNANSRGSIASSKETD